MKQTLRNGNLFGTAHITVNTSHTPDERLLVSMGIPFAPSLVAARCHQRRRLRFAGLKDEGNLTIPSGKSRRVVSPINVVGVSLSYADAAQSLSALLATCAL